jgi:ankyrin repeat protein
MAIKTVKELGSWPAYWDQFPMGKSNGHTALYFAAFRNSLDVVRLLIEKGAEVDARDKYGATPLLGAAWGNSFDDSFERRLAYVFDDSGTSIDAQIVKAGLGIAWIRDGQHRERLIDLQSVATSAARGCLWRNSDAK